MVSGIAISRSGQIWRQLSQLTGRSIAIPAAINEAMTMNSVAYSSVIASKPSTVGLKCGSPSGSDQMTKPTAT